MDLHLQKEPEKYGLKATREWQPVLCALAAAALLHVLFMALSGKWLLSPNAYNSYVRQAAAWLEGRLYLSENVPWLELAVYQGHYYVSFPPFPSYVMLPFVLLYGESAPDHLVAFAAMLLGAGYAVKLARQMGLSHRSSAAFAVFLYCANNLWQITVDGWVWFIAQNFAFTLTVMALYYGTCGKKGRAFFFLCAAVGCRPFQILYIPVLCWLLLRERKKTAKWLLWEKDYRFLPAAALALSFLLLNWARFGNPLEFGHSYLPEFTRSAYGQFSLFYLPENLKSLVRLPSFDRASGQWIFPEYNGCSIFLVYPLLWLWLAAMLRKIVPLCRKKGRNLRALTPELAVLLLACIHLVLLCSHKTMGGAHFGNRYPADVMPLLYLSLLKLERENAANPGGGPWQTAARRGFFALLFLLGLELNFAGVLHFYRTLG